MTSGFPLSRERQGALAIKFLPSYPYVPVPTLLRDSEIQEWRLFQQSLYFGDLLSQHVPCYDSFTMQIYEVSEINRYIRVILEDDPLLSDLWLRGEVSNLTRAVSGHLYFTLKDEEAQISCVMWRSNASLQTYIPRNGEAVVAHGYISVYEVQGRYQFYVDTFQPAGVGLLHLEFERLKKRLAEEGLFDVERKRPLPTFPRRIGVVTSPVGAALRDILHVLRRRYPLVEVILAPTLVQGDEAPSQIVGAIQALNAHTDVDLIIVARGGGSLEELWAFNDEQVARAIVASPVPVVSGVGHETDFTIADFAADVRAPTPSAAAEMVVPDQVELRARLESYRRRLAQGMTARITRQRQALAQQMRTLHRLSPQGRIDQARQRVDDLLQMGQRALWHRLALERERLRSRRLQLESLSPLSILERGYSIVRREDSGEVVRRVEQVQTGDSLLVRVSDGEFGSIVSRL